MLGTELKNYLDEKGIKQVFLCEKTGMSPVIISAILNENRKIDAVEYYKICNALSIPMELLLKKSEN